MPLDEGTFKTIVQHTLDESWLSIDGQPYLIALTSYGIGNRTYLPIRERLRWFLRFSFEITEINLKIHPFKKVVSIEESKLYFWREHFEHTFECISLELEITVRIKSQPGAYSLGGITTLKLGFEATHYLQSRLQGDELDINGYKRLQGDVETLLNQETSVNSGKDGLRRLILPLECKKAISLGGIYTPKPLTQSHRHASHAEPSVGHFDSLGIRF